MIEYFNKRNRLSFLRNRNLVEFSYCKNELIKKYYIKYIFRQRNLFPPYKVYIEYDKYHKKD